MEWLGQLVSNTETMAIFCLFGLPIAAGAVIAIISVCFRHRERMAMIQQGIHPDNPPDEDDKGPVAKPRKFKSA